MKKLHFLALVAFAAWYGWKHPDVFHKHPSNEVVIDNQTGHGLERVRVGVGGQTFVKETIAEGTRASIPFRVDEDASFDLVWVVTGVQGEQHWTGGMVPKGPLAQRFTLTIDGDNQVLFRAENKLGAVTGS